MTHLGVISDTHGYWNPSLPEQFAGVNHILHAGDIGSQIIIDRLEQLAPTTAVLGNTDVGLVFPETASLTIEGYRILIHHIVTVGPSYQPIPRAPDPSKPDLIVFGHTHRPYSQSIDGVLRQKFLTGPQILAIFSRFVRNFFLGTSLQHDGFLGKFFVFQVTHFFTLTIDS